MTTMCPKPKSKCNSIKPQFENEYGEYEVFNEVRYWIYQRRRSPEAPLGKYFHAKIKMRNQRLFPLERSQPLNTFRY